MKWSGLYIILLLASITVNIQHVQAQVPNLPPGVDDPNENSFPVFFDIHAAIHRIELGLSSQTSDKIITGLYYALFFDVSAISDIDQSDAILGKTRFYLGDSIQGWYAGPAAGVQNVAYGDGVKGVFSISMGFDHFFDVEFYYKRNTFRIGFYAEAGINTVGDGFVGLGISAGI